jgi:hypothetical protein
MKYYCTVSGIIKTIEDTEDGKKETINLKFEDPSGRKFSFKGEPEIADGLKLGSAMTLSLERMQKTIEESTKSK